MPSNLLDIFLVVLILVSGIGSFLYLEIANTKLPLPAKILIAVGCRIVSLLAYRHSPHVQIRTQNNFNPTWLRLAFEWLIPAVVMAELVLVACASGSTDGKSMIINFKSFSNLSCSPLCFDIRVPPALIHHFN